MFKDVGNTLSLSHTYQSISWVHYAEHRLSDALDAIEEAWKYAKLAGSGYNQMSISLDLGRILFNTNQDIEAWKYIEIALTNASYIGDWIYVSRALEYMGYGYLQRGDYQNAYSAYEAAAEKYLGTVKVHYMEWCKKNMARIKMKQENPDIVIGFHMPSLEISKLLFYHSSI